MPTYSSLEAKSVEAGVNMLANSSTFQALLGVGTAAAAKAFIIGGDGGDPAAIGEAGSKSGKGEAVDGTVVSLNDVHGVIEGTSIGGDETANRYITLDGAVYVRVFLTKAVLVDALGGDPGPHDLWIEFLNQLGSIRTDMQTLYGSAAGYPLRGAVHSEVAEPTTNRHEQADGYHGRLIINWSKP